MDFIKNIKIRNKLFWSFGLVLALMALVGGVAIYQMQQGGRLMAKLRDNSIPCIQLAGSIESIFQHKRILVMKLITAHDAAEIDELEQENHQLNQQSWQLWRDYERLLSSKDEHDLIEMVQRYYNEYEQMMSDQLLPLVRAHEQDSALALTPQFKLVADRLTALVVDLIKYNDDSSAAVAQVMSDQNQEAIELIILCLVVAIALVIVLTIALSHLIADPLLILVSDAQRVAAGDLSVQVTAQCQDEVGLVTQAFSRMVAQLRETIHRLSDDALSLASSSEHLHGLSNHIASSSEQVVAQSITVSTAGEEMVATTADIANNCQAAANSSAETKQTTFAGIEVVRVTVQGIRQRSEKTKQDAESVTSLGKRTEQIGSIVATIQAIAAQTNLLALNAAIEAARAGEQGRGFAVVADEVRALAGRTTQSTQEISDMIRSIQQEASAATRSMDSSVTEMELVAQEAEKLVVTLDEILHQVNEVNLQITQIATAAEEQTVTTSEISNNMTQITMVVQDMSRGAEQSATAAAHLAEMASNMKKTVAEFSL